MTKERLSDMALRNARAWAAARPDMSGSQAIVDAIDELLERRAADVVMQEYHNVDDVAEIRRLRGEVQAANAAIARLNELIGANDAKLRAHEPLRNPPTTGLPVTAYCATEPTAESASIPMPIYDVLEKEVGVLIAEQIMRGFMEAGLCITVNRGAEP